MRHPDRVAASAFDPSLIEAIVDGDPASAGFLAEAFAQSAVDTIDELRAALGAGNQGELGRLAHRFKSAAGQIGAEYCQQLCLTLERIGQDPVTAETTARATTVSHQLIEGMEALAQALRQLARDLTSER